MMPSATDILQGKILIVDDHATNVLLLERILNGAGYGSIASTTDPYAVCELHRKNHYDLILLDLEMPGAAFSGFQVMARLKEIEPGGYLPVIVITAHPEHKLHAFQAGARDFISKPFEQPEVLARVRNMLEVRLLYVETKNRINALEHKILEVEAERDLLRRQSNEVKRLQENIDALEKNDAAKLSQTQVCLAARQPTLLNIEDNPADTKLVEKIIARHPGIRLLSAVNGNSGIEMARASLPDVILMDINLPDVSGFKALEILRSDPATAHIPVIALSVNASQINIESGFKAGFFRYITKPIKVDEFMQALDAALEHAQRGVGQVP
jgi:CheY-like chemotaxis protein